jgi:hypothetical protein
MPTKRELELEIESLKRKLKAVTNELAPWVDRHSGSTFIPCGKMERVYGHAFQDEICSAVCDQYDGIIGWVRIAMDTDRFTHEWIMVFVEYSNETGTMPGNWCPITEVKRVYV